MECIEIFFQNQIGFDKIKKITSRQDKIKNKKKKKDIGVSEVKNEMQSDAGDRQMSCREVGN